MSSMMSSVMLAINITKINKVEKIEKVQVEKKIEKIEKDIAKSFKKWDNKVWLSMY